ncbi:hypothetical protein BdWA1_003387 [Babesia duncani]|uniref:Uncharacterized protein n=1 Tax=Babesia duncani TaxID=323732 RepID=A0AAD9UMU8_9APIC|nr:hypothetical protein BdWA1_003387 [Babesia duncani]
MLLGSLLSNPGTHCIANANMVSWIRYLETQFFAFVLLGLTQTIAIQVNNEEIMSYYNEIIKKSDVPSEIAKVFSLNDKFECQEIPKECACTFSRLQRLELQCANNEYENAAACNINTCETCCTLSLSSKFENNVSQFVDCKMRCYNSPLVTEITQDSMPYLTEILKGVNEIYHDKVEIDNTSGRLNSNLFELSERKHVSTKYHTIPLDDAL